MFEQKASGSEDNHQAAEHCSAGEYKSKERELFDRFRHDEGPSCCEVQVKV
jgi:hypothetical protein